MQTTREVRKRGVAGRVFLYVFYGFNILMLLWLLNYWGSVGDNLHTGSHAAQTGAAIGTIIGTGFIVFFWVAGAAITGLFVLFNRGQRSYVDVERDDVPASGPEQPKTSKASKGAADGRLLDEGRVQFGRTRPVTTAPGSTAQMWSDILFYAGLGFCGLIALVLIKGIFDTEGVGGTREANEQQSATQPHNKDQKKEVTTSSEAAQSFSDHLSVDNVRVTEYSDFSIAIVTVRVPTKLGSVKCAASQGSRYLGVGSIVNASPPAEDVYITIPGTGYGSSVRAQCSSE